MGTRSLTKIFDEEKREIVCIYRQFDGYPEGMGKDLSDFIKSGKVVNGFGDKKEKQFNGIGCFAAQLICAVIEELSRSSRQTRIRIWHGENGKVWTEENDVTGYVGRSNGSIKVPILIHNKRSLGGGSLLTSCCAKIVETKTNRVIYQHENFVLPVYNVANSTEPGYLFSVMENGTVYSNHKTEAQAFRLRDFLIGKRHSK